MTNDTAIRMGSGNVFADLELPDADALLVKSDLILAITRQIEARGLTQTSAAELMGLTQPMVSNLLRGRELSISVERLMQCLNALDQDVEIIIRPAQGRGRTLETAG